MKKHTVTRAVLATIRRNVFISAALIAAIVGAIIVGVLPPLVLEKVVDSFAQERMIPFVLALYYFLLSALAGLFDAGKESLITVFGQKVTYEIRSAMAEKLNHLPASYFVKTEPGVTTSRIVNDVNTVDALFATGIISMFVDACKIISILVVIFTRSLGLGLLLLLLTPAIIALTDVIKRRMLQAQLENRAAIGNTNQLIPETLQNIRTIHILRKEKYMKERYATAVEDSFNAQEKSNFYNAIYSPLMNAICVFVIGIMMILTVQSGTMMRLFGMSVGTAVAIIAYVGKIFDPIASIGMEIQNIQSAAAGVTRINEFMEETEMAREDDALPVLDANAVDIRNLVFRYEDGANLMNGFDLKVENGEMVTITGRTGAGKSTLFKLILGLYEPIDGEVRIFGVKPGQIPPDMRRCVYGYVEQQFHMIPGTVAQQVGLNDASVSEQEIIQALSLVGLWDEVSALPQGLNTQCNSGLFSQGQFQLLSIARAIVKNPRLLLLDEITANLDSATEKRVLDALQKASQGRTVLSISHRLYEQRGGRTVEIGNNT